MSNNDSDESQRQGFIPNRLIIRQKQHNSVREYSSSYWFQPRYIQGETIMKKQPPQSYLLFTDNQPYFHEIADKSFPQAKERKPSVESIYLTQNYECVYSRFRKPFGSTTKQSFSNDIIIRTLNQYRILKNWKSEYCSNRSAQILKFDSKFESGNLLCAFKSLNQLDTYTLFMQNDTNTLGYNQWFYFSISQAKPNKKYTIKIANFRKKYSFFEKGMQPYIFSLQESRIKKCGWSRSGSSFKYYPSNFSQKQQDHYYTLQFQLQFLHENDFILVCPYPPYSFSKLVHHLQKYQQQAIQKGVKFQIQSISKTLGGNYVPYLKIFKEGQSQKKVIIITARQHSGQIWSSYLVDQIIKGLVEQKHNFYQWIINHFDFHIFPMVNVDGVIYGNFRCDLGGYDLNRCWKDPSPILHPQLFKIKSVLQNIIDTSGVQYFFDLHTHSKEHGFFNYCCVESVQGRKLSQLMSVLSPLFRQKACTFGIQQYKNSTIRSQMFNLTRNINTVTIQLSSFGYKHPHSNILQPFSIEDIQAIAKTVITAIYYFETKQTPAATIEDNIKQTIFMKESSIFVGNDHSDAASESDSDPEADQINESIKIKKIFKHLKIKSDIKIKKKVNKGKNKKQKLINNLSTSLEINQLQSIEFSPTNRFRALTETKQNKQSLQSPIKQMRKFVLTNFETRRAGSSFNKMVRLTKLNGPTRLKQSEADSSTKLQKIKKQKPLNLIQFSLKKLPIFPIQKLTNHFVFQIPSQSLTANKKLQQDKVIQNKVATFYRTKKQAKSSNNPPINETNQFLCVMSQSKKKQQFQRIKERREKLNESQMVSKLKLNVTRQSTVLQRYMKEKTSNKSDNIAKIWMNNFHRYSKSLEDQP